MAAAGIVAAQADRAEGSDDDDDDDDYYDDGQHAPEQRRASVLCAVLSFGLEMLCMRFFEILGCRGWAAATQARFTSDLTRSSQSTSTKAALVTLLSSQDG